MKNRKRDWEKSNNNQCRICEKQIEKPSVSIFLFPICFDCEKTQYLVGKIKKGLKAYEEKLKNG